MLSAVAAALALAGPGIYALDYVFGIAWPEPATFLIGLGVVIVGVSLALRGIPWALEAWTRDPQRNTGPSIADSPRIRVLGLLFCRAVVTIHSRG